ncbi:MAG: hydroxyphenylacetyl-CoA thioesterase PaaI [Woeseiaceae bacterium]
MNDLDRARRSADTMLERDESTRSMGIDIVIPAPGVAVATMTVRPDMLNGFSVTHGGVVFALADTAFAFACNAYNNETLSVEADISWLRPAREADTLVATASEDRRAGRHGWYSVQVLNQRDEVVANFKGHCVARNVPLFVETDT